MEIILLLGVLALALWLFLMRGEVAYLKRRVSELDALLAIAMERISEKQKPAPRSKIAARAVAPDPEAVAQSAPVIPPENVKPPEKAPAQIISLKRPLGSAPEQQAQPLESKTEKPGFTNPFAGASFEDLVGGKLPIWIGGIALVFAGFFLVRYTIEAGLLGPGARSVIATCFALLLIAISEFGGKLPKVGEAFKADPRVAQSLAGAGVATLYGTLYMAAEIYGLIGVGTAFTLVVVVTIIAFVLALRHGPPTALMGLVGGFAAPWVAGMTAANLPSLLLYLAVFIAALFGLAIWRRWLWLLVLASGGGALWSFAMLFTAQSDFSLLGLFILVSGAGALFAFTRFSETNSYWRELGRYAPTALALLQLAMLLPKMRFSALGWGFYAALSVVTILLAWRERRMVPMVIAALLLAIAPLAVAWDGEAYRQITPAITLGIALLFGLAGHAAVLRDREPKLAWAGIGLAAPVLCWFASYFAYPIEKELSLWGYAALAAALPAAWLAWNRHQRQETGAIQLMASAIAAMMLLIAAKQFSTGGDWDGVLIMAIAFGLSAWALVTGDRGVRRLAIVPLAAAMIWAVGSSYKFILALNVSLFEQISVYEYLPSVTDAVKTTLLPATMMLAMLWPRIFAMGARTRMVTWAVGGAGLVAMIWLLAKQVAGIESPSDFIRLAFAERAVFTHILFAGSWFALSQVAARPQWPSLKWIGWALAATAIFRVVWFDLLLLNPAFVAQSVGPIPIANLASGHMALTAIWLWLLSKQMPTEGKGKAMPLTLQILSLGAMIATILATVRQLMQGSIMAKGYIDTGENYLYSVGLLALSIAWLARGMLAGSRLLRLAGLSLLTLVTLKVFLIDAAALTGVLRILSFLGLGIALIGIGWAYGRVMGTVKTETESTHAD